MTTKSKEDFAALVITAPFTFCIKIAQLSNRAITSFRNRPSAPPPVAPAIIIPQPVVTANAPFTISDRTHKQSFGSLKVSFYQYVKLRHIKIVGMKDGKRKEKFYTPEIARKSAVPYSMESAINWVREVGFKDDISAPVVASASVNSTPIAKSTEVAAPVQKIVHAEPVGAKTRPFTGKIVSMGIVQRKGQPGKKDYEIFQIKLEAQYGGVEKEFSGEHLAELAEEMSLKPGQLVTIQKLGFFPFAIIVNDKEEQRSRNHFSVTVH